MTHLLTPPLTTPGTTLLSLSLCPLIFHTAHTHPITDSQRKQPHTQTGYPPPSLSLPPPPFNPFYWPFVFFFLLFGLPRPLINPTNSKGYINVDNQFLYVSSQSLEKNQKKIKTVIFNCANVFFLLFLMLLHLLI